MFTPHSDFIQIILGFHGWEQGTIYIILSLLLAKHYGFTEEELDFIINYDIKYRMGDELNKEEE